jgi:hypothetical protein
MFKRNSNKKKPDAIPTSMQEWPNHDESWAEFMVRTDGEGIVSSKVAFFLGCMILAAFVIWIAVDALDKAVS